MALALLLAFVVGVMLAGAGFAPPLDAHALTALVATEFLVLIAAEFRIQVSVPARIRVTLLSYRDTPRALRLKLNDPLLI